MISVPNLLLLLVLCFCWSQVVSVHFRERLVINIVGGLMIGFGMKLAGLQVIS